MVSDDGGGVETETEGLVGLAVFLLDDGGRDLAHEKLGFEDAVVELEGDSVVHEHNKILIKL